MKSFVYVKRYKIGFNENKVQQYEANSKAKNYYQHGFAVHWINPTYRFF